MGKSGAPLEELEQVQRLARKGSNNGLKTEAQARIVPVFSHRIKISSTCAFVEASGVCLVRI